MVVIADSGHLHTGDHVDLNVYDSRTGKIVMQQASLTDKIKLVSSSYPVIDTKVYKVCHPFSLCAEYLILQ